ncbi:MAG: hypothetical protein Ta2B_16720 [Termitinemataceae bacterium]|nr:MAG: hypothetical protein Ta2B_16720 [Termitinemataceae bacterium]
METAIQQPQMGLTFEQVWAALMETRAHQEKTEENMDRMIKRADKMSEDHEATKRMVRETSVQIKETEKAIKETSAQIEETKKMVRETSEQMKRTDEQMKRTDERIERMSKNLGGLGESLGALIETLIAAKLWEKFDAYPYNLKRAYQRVPLYDENNRILTDIDILLSNGDYAMGVEAKREFDKEKYVDQHLKRMELIKKYPPAECKGKKLLGAIAGGIVDPDVQDYAHKAGFFVLELTGESVQLAEPPTGFIARQW